MSVRKSPKLNPSLSSENMLNKEFSLLERKIIPTVTKRTPRIFPSVGIRFSIIVWRMGVNRTNVPVMNADFVAVVYCSPIVCTANPMYKKTPRINPSLNFFLEMDLNKG